MLSGTVAIVMILAVIIALLVQPAILLIIAMILGMTYFEKNEAPERTIKAFVDAIVEQDVETARQLVSRDSEEVMNMILPVLETNLDGNVMIEQFKNMYSADCTAPVRDTSVCTICMAEGETCQDLTLIKENGEWVIALSFNKEGGTK